MPKKAFSMIELLVSMMLIAAFVVVALTYAGFVKSYLVKAENYAAATTYLCQTLETLSSAKYSVAGGIDTSITPNTTHDKNSAEAKLPDGCILKTKFNGTRSYTVSAETKWDSNFSDATNNYIRITATVTYDGAPRTFTMSIIRTKSP